MRSQELQQALGERDRRGRRGREREFTRTEGRGQRERGDCRRESLNGRASSCQRMLSRVSSSP